MGGMCGLGYESAPFIFKGRTYRLQHFIRLISTGHYRIDAKVATESNGWTNYGIWWFRLEVPETRRQVHADAARKRHVVLKTVGVLNVVGALGILSMIMAFAALVVLGVLTLIGVVTVPEVLQTLSTAVSGA